MSSINFFKLGIILIFIMLSNLACRETSKSTAQYKSNEILIKFKAETSDQAIESLIKEFDLIKVKDIKNLNISVFKIPSNVSIEEAVQQCQQSPIIEYAEPNYTYHVDAPKK